MHLLCNKWSKQEESLNIRQSSEGPKENHKGDQRTGAAAFCGKTEEIRSFHPGDENAQVEGAHHRFSVL